MFCPGLANFCFIALLGVFAIAAVARPCQQPQAPQEAQVATESIYSGQILTLPPQDVQPRLDILVLASEPDLAPQLDLFLQAYARLQQRPPSSPVSYFQLAGIHGQPYVAWDGVTSLALTVDPSEPINGTQPGLLNTFAGYCWHASVLFPMWHRAYLLLIEQEVRKEALAIASEYSGHDRIVYMEAAQQLRFPHWDWTSEEAAAEGVPELMLQANVTVYTPQGWRTIKNPLESFIFPADVAQGNAGTSKNDAGFGSNGQRAGNAPSMRGDRTVRHPDENLQPQYEQLQEDMRSQVSQSIRPAWFKLYTDPNIAKSWGLFSTNAVVSGEPDQLPPVSMADIEGIHDLIHDVIGGIVFSEQTGYPGHMSDVDIAAFDPIFFLHHANVDRLTALYQHKNPATWLKPRAEPFQRTYVTGLNGYTPDRTTPLWPFRKAPDTFYTSDDMRDWTSLGYTYPDFLLQNATELTSPAPSTENYGFVSAPSPSACSLPAEPIAAEIFQPDDFKGFRWYLDVAGLPMQLCSGSALLSVYVQDAAGLGEENVTLPVLNGTSVDNILFAGSVAIFTHGVCQNCVSHNMSISGQVDITEQLLMLGLVQLRDAAYYNNLSEQAQPEPQDRPPPDLIERNLIVQAQCPLETFVLDDDWKQELLSLTWGRLVFGYQIVGA